MYGGGEGVMIEIGENQSVFIVELNTDTIHIYSVSCIVSVN